MTGGRPVRVGYWLSSEEHGPNELVRLAARAEECGFAAAAISDHFHPWTTRQGQSPFVWSVLGGIAHATDRLRVVTGVTAPIIRIHPAIVAQAAATAAVMFDGRFALGVGTGERLNEHVTGAHWPSPDMRRDMLEEAVGVMRRLWSGRTVDHEGAHYAVQRAQLFTLPETPPEVIVAASSTKSVKLAGRIGDGLFALAPSERLVDAFEGSGGHGKRRMGQLHVCWAEREEDARATAHEWWPNAALGGGPLTELAHPRHVEQALALARPEDTAEAVVLGPDAERHVRAIAAFADAGFDEVHVHQAGPDQEGFLRFYEREVLPAFPDRADATGAGGG